MTGGTGYSSCFAPVRRGATCATVRLLQPLQPVEQERHLGMEKLQRLTSGDDGSDDGPPVHLRMVNSSSVRVHKLGCPGTTSLRKSGRGGRTTKVHLGERVKTVFLTPGQAADCAQALLAGHGETVVGDKAYDTDAI